MPQDAAELVTSAANSTLALIAHRQGETDLLTERARHIWDLAHVHQLNRRAIRDRLLTELEARGVTAEQVAEMGREGLGVSLTRIYQIISGPRP